ncbi:U32 family peptidase [Mycoplasmatota bacterium]|nr:U32 family peptidase [Mycoplasmatota bacterium]
MARYFNNKLVELLAPAGTFEIFKEIIKTKCDAVYFGGRILNMRMIRPGYNLIDSEVIEAIKIAHQYDKKAYVTINNLNGQEDIDAAKSYLTFLDKVAKPDAIIVQDMAIIELIKEMKLSLEIHSSVMMNVHNLETVKALDKIGVKRIVVSRDFSLNTVRYFKTKVPHMEFEYFTHGDMCTVHGSQCYYSSLLFGMSSNRGRCLKPCRWWYQVKKDGNVHDPKFPLASKDMYMYEHLPEMIEAGVTSFKIEGRMREKDFIVKLVNWYGDALDRYIKDPLHFDRYQDKEEMYKMRKRDLSTCYALSKPGLDNINTRYEGTGKFYSTGKMFSKPTVEKEINEVKIKEIKGIINHYPKKPKQLKLSVKVNNIKQALLCIQKKVDIIYLSGNVYQPDKPWCVDDINMICKNKGNSKILLGTPKIFDELDFERYHHLLKYNQFNLDGISVTNIGALSFFKSFGYDLYGDYAFNIYNDLALKFYNKYDLKQSALSIEMPINDLCATINKSPIKTELIVHGLIDVMHLEHDLYENTLAFDIIGKENNLYVDNQILVLKNEAGEYPIYKDDRGRNHLHNTKEINLIKIMDNLATIGLDCVRIEAQTYTLNQMDCILDVYSKYLSKDITVEEASKRLKPNYYGYTLGALYHEVK